MNYTNPRSPWSGNNRRPSLTALQRLENEHGSLEGYFGAGFDLRTATKP